MKHWAFWVVVLYGAILAVLALPLIVAAFVGEDPLSWLFGDYRGVWIFVAIWCVVMMLAQAALLVVPVRVAAQRPVRRRHVFWTILAAFVMLLVMAGTMCLAVTETVANNSYYSGSDAQMLWISIVVGVWLLWSLLLGFYTGARDPRTMMARLTGFLLAGSILELLVAVPTHILARSRHYCCAGFGTFFGLAAGLSVMLFAFGPAVFVMFVRRWQSVRNNRRPDRAEARGEKEAGAVVDAPEEGS